jgi:hypothetical protein
LIKARKSMKDKIVEQSTTANRRQSPTRKPNAGGDCGSASVTHTIYPLSF